MDLQIRSESDGFELDASLGARGAQPKSVECGHGRLRNGDFVASKASFKEN